ncbi:MAG: hypothetical protein EHM45_03230 [Desulfobacteraceae bacterium]|nr:MAG: hypothetical protein EHM45_03230 [Desulfobacteraceae bacterium]
MKIRSGLIFISATLFLFISATECLASGGRLYSGKPLAPNEVALFILQNECKVDYFKEEGMPELKLSFAFQQGEVIPGRNYYLCIGYDFRGAGITSKSIGCSTVVLDPLPGHVYYIYPELMPPDHWKPICIDIANDEDYKKIPNGDRIQKRVKAYFDGDRREITKGYIVSKSDRMGKPEPNSKNRNDFMSCQTIFDNNPNHGNYFHHFLKNLNKSKILINKKSVFTVAGLSFSDPEWIILIYETKERVYMVEKIIAKSSVWQELNEQAQRRYLSLEHVPKTANILLPKLSIQYKKQISDKTSNILKQAFEKVTSQSGRDVAGNSHEEKKLENRILFLISPENDCGQPVWELNSEYAEKLGLISDLLEKYLQDQATERDIFNAVN